MDIIVLASGDGSTFQAILEKCKHANILALVTNNPDAGVIKRVKKTHLPYVISKHKDVLRATQYFNPQLVVLAGYMRILNEKYIESYPNIVNIHPSLLPKYKGLDTYKRVLEAKDPKHGTTVHWVNNELDSGEIIAQEKISIRPKDTIKSLQDRIQGIERELYPRIIDQIATGEIMAQTR